MFPFEQTAQQMKGVTRDEIEWMGESESPMGTETRRQRIACPMKFV